MFQIRLLFIFLLAVGIPNFQFGSLLIILKLGTIHTGGERYEKYGYKTQSLTGLKDWYEDYMNKDIKSSNGYIGLPEEVYTLKPAKSSDFKYSYEIDEFHEPQNIIEDIRQVLKNVVNNVKRIKTLNQVNN